jgi:hypothetical protein
MINVLYFQLSTFRSMWAVPNKLLLLLTAIVTRWQ